ncbi:MAG: DJ-1/PfpI family protein [Oscillospiraceae bacterium]|nr:DJ-1/PfpI family protein [Oscillospiraceae bacterium]
MICVFLADGFEEIEAFTTIDILRRAKINVKSVGIGNKFVTGAHDIVVVADKSETQINFQDLEGLVLPGGMPGTVNLETSSFVKEAINLCVSKNLLIAAICAAPSILGHMGFLEGKTATCYPGFEQELTKANVSKLSVCKDSNIITARGPGSAFDFALEIVKSVKEESLIDSIKSSICLFD